jgi:hypothetical protein
MYLFKLEKIPWRNKKVKKWIRNILSLKRGYYRRIDIYKPGHIIMMWKFEVNPLRNEEVSVKNHNF